MVKQHQIVPDNNIQWKHHECNYTNYKDVSRAVLGGDDEGGCICIICCVSCCSQLPPFNEQVKIILIIITHVRPLCKCNYFLTNGMNLSVDFINYFLLELLIITIRVLLPWF
jgi:hypothetical protein